MFSREHGARVNMAFGDASVPVRLWSDLQNERLSNVSVIRACKLEKRYRVAKGISHGVWCTTVIISPHNGDSEYGLA